MTNFEHMKETVLNTIAALDQEELRQLVADTCMDEGDSKAIFSCGICEEVFGDCDVIPSGNGCTKKYLDWCGRKYKPEISRESMMEVIKRYGIAKKNSKIIERKKNGQYRI